MNYGIDIDDTISKTAEKFIEYGKIYNSQVLKREYNDKLTDIKNHYYLKTIFNWNEEEEKSFLEDYGYYKKMIESVELKENVLDILLKLKKNGDSIYLITARYRSDKFSVEDETEKWLKKNTIPYDELIVDAIDKEKVCKDKKIDIFIDDSYENFMKVASQGIKTYLMTTELNKNTNSGEIQRISGWKDINV